MSKVSNMLMSPTLSPTCTEKVSDTKTQLLEEKTQENISVTDCHSLSLIKQAINKKTNKDYKDTEYIEGSKRENNSIDITIGKKSVTVSDTVTQKQIDLLYRITQKYQYLSDSDNRLFTRSLCRTFGFPFTPEGLELLVRRYKSLGFDVWDFIAGKPLISSPRNTAGPGVYFLGNDGRAYLPEVK